MDPEHRHSDLPARLGARLRALIAFMVWIARPEKLPPPRETTVHDKAVRPSVLRRLFAPEVLPEFDVPETNAAHGMGFSSWLLRPERLSPCEQVQDSPPGPGTVRWLFTREKLPATHRTADQTEESKDEQGL